MLVLSCDPGLDGAIALLAPHWAKVLDLPTKQDEVNGRRINCPLLAQLLGEHIPPGADIRVCIEAIANGGMGKGRTNAATVGSQFWTQSALVNTLELLGLEVDEYVYPVSWKRFYGLNGKQGNAAEVQRETRELAVTLYPELAQDLKLQKHHNRADAVLVGHFFRKVKL